MAEKKSAWAHVVEKIDRKAAIFAAIVLGVFFLYTRVNELAQFAPVSDELSNIVTVKYLDKNIIPLYAPGTYSPNYKKLPMKPYVYWEYSAELYLFRYPVYFFFSKILGQNDPMGWNWSVASNLVPVFMLLIALIIYYARSRSMSLSPLSVGFLICIVFLWRWSGQSFHYIRHYSFTVISIVVCHFYANYIMTHSKASDTKKDILIILVAAIPLLFNLLNATYLVFWIIFISLRRLRAAYQQNGIQALLKGIAIAAGATLLTAGAGFLILKFVIGKNILGGHLYININNMKVIPHFFQWSINNGVKSLIAVALLIAAAVFRAKRMDPYERGLLLTAVGFVTTALAVLSISGGETTLSHPTRYTFFFHVGWLIIAAVLLSNFVQFLSERLPTIPLKKTGLFFAALVAFSYCYREKIDQIPGFLYLQPKKEIQGQIDKLARVIDRDTVVISADPIIIWLNFPRTKYYFFRPIELPSKTDMMNLGRYGVDKHGFIVDWYGDTYVGNMWSFVKMLKENESKVIVFDGVRPTDDALWGFLKRNGFNVDHTPIAVKKILERLPKGNSFDPPAEVTAAMRKKPSLR
ncbi:MAG: hypothetical protein AABZ39_09430 [Spirochaetota bacterium]